MTWKQRPCDHVPCYHVVFLGLGVLLLRLAIANSAFCVLINGLVGIMGFEMIDARCAYFKVGVDFPAKANAESLLDVIIQRRNHRLARKRRTIWVEAIDTWGRSVRIFGVAHNPGGKPAQHRNHRSSVQQQRPA